MALSCALRPLPLLAGFCCCSHSEPRCAALSCALRLLPFRAVFCGCEVEDGILLGFAAFIDLQVSVEEGAEATVPPEVSDLWVVPKRATGDADIGDVYGVALEDEDEATDEEDLDRWAKLLVALLLTFLTWQPCPLPPLPLLTLPHSWFSSMIWIRRC